MDSCLTRIKAITAMAMLALTLLLAAPAGPAFAADATDEQALVDEAQATFRECMAAPEMEWFRGALKGANGIMIIPGLLKAGLIFGGSGGKGVFFAKDEMTGKWLGPAFYGLGSFTVGLQVGAEKSDVVLLAMTHDAVKALVVPKLTLGADASVAAGPVGYGAAGGQAHPSAGFVSFARSKGAFLGLTLEGLVINVGDNSNEVYYGKSGVNPEDIFISGKVSSPAAEGFRQEIQQAAGGEVKTGAPQETVPAPAVPEGEVKPVVPGEQAPAPPSNTEAVPQEKTAPAAPEREWPVPQGNGLGAVPPEAPPGPSEGK